MTGRLLRVRSRSLFVRHAPLRRLRRSLTPRSTGILGPLAVAVVLAVAGSQLDEAAQRPAAPAARQAAVAAASPVVGLGVADFPERVVRGTTVPRSTERVAPRAAAKPVARASRSRARTAPARTSGWVRPCRGPLTSTYGMRWGRMHKGLDFGCSYGSPIYAASAGVVTYAGPQGGYGRLVTIRHDGGWTTAYGHMSSMVVRSGQRVTAGQLIAYVGSAGHSTGPHLHFEVRTGGGTINPWPFLRARGVRV
jgi:murein DD-endopeptidase MepM/ murein hydrolase activator NlpD